MCYNRVDTSVDPSSQSSSLMKKWDTVAIVGVGLLGGSIGLALQQRGLARSVIGIGRRASSLQKARRYATVTTTTTNLARGVTDAQVVIVCTPVGHIVDHVCDVAAHCPPAALITDVGSTKQEIVRQLHERLGPEVKFIGSHPLAGSEKTGSGHSTADLFQGRVAVVTPHETSGAEAVTGIEGFWKSLGARTLRMTPADHDQAVAMSSHVPHVVAAALAMATSAEELPLVAGGWKDTTRIAASDPQLWWQILSTNREQVLKSLDKFGKVLSQFRNALEQGDRARLEQLLDAGKKTRDSVGS